MSKPNLSISFSGGRTSAYMTWWLLNFKRDDYNEIVITFANTGQEHEKTLEFINRCDKEFGFNTVWLEAVVSPEKGIGTTHKIVDFETASRNGEPYEQVIKKYGIPNQTWQICNRELKLAVMRSYLRSIGWKKGTYQTAIGIRADEMDRVSSQMAKEKIIYPLVEMNKCTKEIVNNWWSKQNFNLEIPEHLGNCTWCWKKSKRKLLTLAVDHPEVFEFPMRMESLYSTIGAEFENGTNQHERRVFFRNHTSANDLLEEAKKPFVKFEETIFNADIFDFEMDSAGSCNEGCEVFI